MTPAGLPCLRQVVGWHRYEAIEVARELMRLYRLELNCKICLRRTLK